MKLGLTGFLLPFFFIFEPALLLDIDSISESLLPILTATLGAVGLAAGLQGWLLTNVSLIQRFLLIIAGFLMIESSTRTDVIGLVLLIGLLLWQWGTKRKEASKVNISS